VLILLHDFGGVDSGGGYVSAGDHVLPNVGMILDKSVYLLETISKNDQ